MPPGADDETGGPASLTEATPSEPSARAQQRADRIISALLGLVIFVVVIGTLGNIWNQAIRVDVAVVGALLTALATYAIAGKVTGK